MSDIIIIGGGASGMLAALTAAERFPGRVTLIERQARVGRKLLSTGNGRCNLTNTELSIKNYHGAQPEFAAPALEAFGPEQTLEFFSGLGLMTVREYGGRVYPLSNQANSVLDVLRFALDARGVRILAGEPVKSVRRERGGFSLGLGGERVRSEKLVVACGGCAGAKLGGVMDGYELLGSLGHSRTSLYPALSQIKTDSTYPRALKGVRADARVSLIRGGKTLASSEGEVLFADTAASGTAVFSLARAAAVSGKGTELSFDFFRGRGEGKLTAHIMQMARSCPELPANQVLTGTVHNRLGQMLCKYAGLGAQTLCRELGETEIRRLSASCRDFRMNVTGVSGFESAQVTAGGVRTSEFWPETLESRLVPGLFACGEVLDIDGDCGGYNLQWAWSSGRLAGRLGL